MGQETLLISVDKTRRIVTAFGVDHWIDNKPTVCDCFNVTFSQGTI